MKTVVTADIHLTDETEILSRAYDDKPTMRWDTINLDGTTIYVSTREQAERLFDAAAEVAMRWRERDPEHFRVEATIAQGGGE